MQMKSLKSLIFFGLFQIFVSAASVEDVYATLNAVRILLDVIVSAHCRNARWHHHRSLFSFSILSLGLFFYVLKVSRIFSFIFIHLYSCMSKCCYFIFYFVLFTEWLLIFSFILFSVLNPS